MSFPEISSRGGIATTNSISIQNILLSNHMSQDGVANLDSMVEAAIEASSQEREERNKTLNITRSTSRRQKLQVQ